MGKLLIVGLLVAWVAVLGPSVLRRGDERSPSSLDAARDRLAAIHHGRRSSVARSGPIFGSLSGYSRGLADPVRRVTATDGLRSRQRRRRKQILQLLFGSCVLTLLLAVGVSSRALLLVHLAADAALAAYLVLLRQIRGSGSQATRNRPPSRAAMPVRHTYVPVLFDSPALFDPGFEVDYSDDYDEYAVYDDDYGDYRDYRRAVNE